ncbi:urease accessory protein ureD [Pseudoponticoccus marisrubri]|uniref:Urease accessory protein UreD n=1 Tax=Pseudoponticoccus marisrubri TaxID=1685382 RepID=A0A0W7WFI9_9RHOB|nr:urease accessory protein ureD [Pseudoponticoccus marisrubri]
MTLRAKARDGQSALAAYRGAGCLKALFPRGRESVEAIVINSSGGLTGGDRLDLDLAVGAGAALTVTTQAAERAYRAAAGEARVTSTAQVAAGGMLSWLPQELILYDGAALQRRLQVALEPGARLLLVEPVLFGRRAMGEQVRQLAFRDRIEITRAGRPLYTDALRLDGDAVAQLARPGVAGGMGAMAALVYVAADAEAQLPRLRAMLPASGGASLIGADLLVLRLLAQDGFALRQALLPILDRLSRETLPASWRL